MKRESLEHLIRAASAITQEYELLIIGSQSILGAYPNAPEEFLISREADIAAFKPSTQEETLVDLIDGTIGEDSPFDKAYGYYAQGVSIKTATLPEGWRDRLIRIQSLNTDMKVGYCLDPHDLAIAKLVAGREKDHVFVKGLLRQRLINLSTLKDRLSVTPLDEPQKQWIKAWLQGREAEMKSRFHL